MARKDWSRPMPYDYIQRAIDIQLGGDHPHNPENLICNAIDMKYHYSDFKEEKIVGLAMQGFTQKEISLLTGYKQRAISKRLRTLGDEL